MSQTGSYVTSLVWETTDAEGPTRAEYQTNWNAMDGHLHDNRGAGRGIRGIQTTSAPTQTGDVQINGDALQWWGASSAAVVTAVNPNVAVSSLLFSGPAGVANTRFVGILSASGAPIAGTWLKYDFGYDEAGNAWLCTVAGSPGTWIRVGPKATYTGTMTGNVALTNQNQFYDGPIINPTQGTGTFLVVGRISFSTSATDLIDVSLNDGTSVYDSVQIDGIANPITINVQGIAVNPVGQIRISAKDVTAGGHTTIIFNNAGNSLDSSLVAVRLW